MKRYNLSPGDFPDIEDFRSKLREQDFSKFAALKPQLVESAEATLSTDIPRLMEALPRSTDSEIDVKLITPAFENESITGEISNPFGEDEAAAAWCIEPFVSEYKPEFEQH